jgi:NADH:ubiquinone oxidoreductase subunit E
LNFIGIFFAKSKVFPILQAMQPTNVKICTGRSCGERHSEYIQKRLEADREFYWYKEEELVIETCLCQGRCKEGPTVVYNNDIQIYQNPVKASEILHKKIIEARKRINTKK